MSDILFLSVKAHAGKLVTDHGKQTSVADLCSLTASAGKDLYLAGAQIVARSGASTGPSVFVELQANGVTKALAELEFDNGTQSTDSYKFVIRGIRVTAGQVIKLRVTGISSGVEVSGEIIGYEEDTNDSPFQPSEFE